MGVKTDDKSFKKAESGMGSLVKAAKVAAAAFASLAIVKSIKGAVEEVAQLGDRFDKLSKRTGVAARTLQEFDHAAALSGASLGDVETALRKLQAGQVDAAAGLKTYTREWDRLGIEIKTTDGGFKDTTDLLIEMADGMQNLESDAERTAVATKLLGRSGTTLIPMLKNGSAALQEMMGELKDYGGIIEDDMIQASADFIDGQRRIDMVLQGLKITLAKEVIPWVNKAVSGMLEWWKINGAWIRQDIIRPIGKFVRVLGRVVRVIAKVVAWFVKFLVKLDPAVKGLIVFVAALSQWQKIVKLLLSPLGKLLIGIGFLIVLFDDLNTFLEGGDSLFGRLVKTVEEWLGLPIEEEVRNIIGWFGKLVDDQDGAVNDLVDGVEEFGEAIRYFFTEFIPDKVGEGLTAAFGENAKAVLDMFVSDLKTLFQTIWDVISWPFKEIAILIGEVFEFGIPTMFANLKTDIEHWMNGIRESVFGFIDTIKNKFKSFFEGGVFSSAKNLFSGTFGGGVARSAAGGARGGINNALNNKIDVVVNAAPGMNENQLAAATASKLNSVTTKQNRDAMRVFSPRVSAGVI
jgi:hypothetical protein